MNKFTFVLLLSLFGHAFSECVTRRTEALSARECADDCKCQEKPCSISLSWQIDKFTGRKSDLDSALCACKTCTLSNRDLGEDAEESRPGRNRCVIRSKTGINEAECKQSCYCTSPECTGRWKWSAKNRADYRTFLCECELCNDKRSDLENSAPSLVENRYHSVTHQ